MPKLTIKATPEMVELAKDAMRVQDACNLCGIAQSFAKVMLALNRTEQNTLGTDYVKFHPVTYMWIDKFASLARMEQGTGIRQYDACYELSEGKDVEYEFATS